MQTPLKKLIEGLRKEVGFITDTDSEQDRFYRQGLKAAIIAAASLLPEQKQMVVDAFNRGSGNPYDSTEQAGTNYFTDKYEK